MTGRVVRSTSRTGSTTGSGSRSSRSSLARASRRSSSNPSDRCDSAPSRNRSPQGRSSLRRRTRPSRGSASRSRPARTSPASSSWPTPSRTLSATPTSGWCPRSPRAWALRWRTRGSSTKRNAPPPPAPPMTESPTGAEEGKPTPPEPMVLGEGLTSIVIQSRQALRLGTASESEARGAITSGVATESWLGVPILAGDRVLRAMALESMKPHAFFEADERLLGTLASSMGVALENARLFDETKRLLTETDQRAAELAIINGVQQGLASELDMQAMYDLVGDKIQDIFDAQVVDIGIYDKDAGLMRFPYTIERGVRFPDEPMTLIGFRRHVMDSGEPLLVNRDAGRLAGGDGQPAAVPGGPR